MQIDTQNGQPRATAYFNHLNPSTSTLQLDHLKLNSGVPYLAEFHVDPYVSSFSLDYTDHASSIRYNTPLDLVNPTSIVVGSTNGNPDGFGGCMKILRLNNAYVNLTDFPADSMAIENNMIQESSGGDTIPYYDRRDVTLGCSYLASCANLGASYCPSGMVCKDIWKGPVCTCPVNK